jgi:hypothetical protein
MMWIDDCIVSRGLVCRPQSRIRILPQLDYGKDIFDDASVDDGFDKFYVLWKVLEVVAQLEERVTLLVELKYGPVFGLSSGEIRPVPETARSFCLCEDPIDVAPDSRLDLLSEEMHKWGIHQIYDVCISLKEKVGLPAVNSISK